MASKLKALLKRAVTWVRHEPAQVWLGWVAGGLGLVATWGLPWLTVGQAALAVALINAVAMVIAAWKTKPRSPAILTGVVSAAVALLAGYGVHVSQDVIGVVNTILVGILSLHTRAQVSPVKKATVKPAAVARAATPAK